MRGCEDTANIALLWAEQASNLKSRGTHLIIYKKTIIKKRILRCVFSPMHEISTKRRLIITRLTRTQNLNFDYLPFREDRLHTGKHKSIVRFTTQSLIGSTGTQNLCVDTKIVWRMDRQNKSIWSRNSWLLWRRDSPQCAILQSVTLIERRRGALTQTHI